MLRVFGPVILGLGLLVLWIYCIVDVIATERRRVRYLPKMVWLPITILLPVIGSLLWLGIGRPPFAGVFPGEGSRAPVGGASQQAPLGIEDSPQWADDRLAERERELRRRERELRRRERELRTDDDRETPPER